MTNISANTPRLTDPSIAVQKVDAEQKPDAIELAKSQLYSLGLEEGLQNEVNSLQAWNPLRILGIGGGEKPKLPDLLLADLYAWVNPDRIGETLQHLQERVDMEASKLAGQSDKKIHDHLIKFLNSKINDYQRDIQKLPAELRDISADKLRKFAATEKVRIDRGQVGVNQGPKARSSTFSEDTLAAEDLKVQTQTVKAMTSLLENELQIAKPSAAGSSKPDLSP
ncbi:MAG: hypothetical protein I8H77_11010 [Comamonadaceae bacterium]|nr:hypothetical protein [Comamonadaceae bacterium]